MRRAAHIHLSFRPERSGEPEPGEREALRVTLFVLFGSGSRVGVHRCALHRARDDNAWGVGLRVTVYAAVITGRGDPVSWRLALFTPSAPGNKLDTELAAARNAPHVNLNPLLLGTAAPPIPEAKAWTVRYRGAVGPLIDLSQAVPGYPPPDELLRRIAEAASTPEASTYGDILGDRDLRERYATHISGLYGGGVAPSEVAITAGCNQAFVVAIMALAKAGDAVMLPTPWYFNHKMTLDLLGIETIELPCRAEAGFVPDAADAEPLIDGRVRAVVLVTPNNPTGAIYPPATIRAFAELCAKRGVALIVDETYRDFLSAEAARPHDLFADSAWRDTAVELYSFSKAYCIPGQRMGALVAGARFVDEIAKILDCVQICPSRPPQRALVWAIDALASWRDGNREIILDRAAAFRSALDRLDGWSIESIGAYFAYLRHPFPGRSAEKVAEWLAVERGVLCLPGSYFGGDQQAFLRVAFANVDAATIVRLRPRLAGAMPERRAAAGRRRA